MTTELLNTAREKMDRALAFFKEEMASVRAGRASAGVLNGVEVDYYGSQVPVAQVASITVPDARTILIQPWEKNLIATIEKAIMVANIGLTPSNNGEHIRLNVPPLTEERRKELVRQVREQSEGAKISLRNARRDAVEGFKKAQKEGMPEDMAKDGEAEAQKLVDGFGKKLDALVAEKEQEIMTV